MKVEAFTEKELPVLVSSGSETERAPRGKEASTEKSAEISPEAAVERLERAVNSNEVRFNISDEGDVMKFQVVEKGTGRILRQFPSDELPDLLERADKGSVLIEGIA